MRYLYCQLYSVNSRTTPPRSAHCNVTVVSVTVGAVGVGIVAGASPEVLLTDTASELP